MKLKMFTRFAFSVLLVGLISLGSRLQVGSEAEHAVLRLSWSLVGEQITKSLTEAELADLPVHMRPADGVFESIPVFYRLEVSVDGELRQSRTVKPAGLRADRPMYVLNDIPLSPGPHRVELSFQPLEAIEGAITYFLAEEITFQPGQIVTVDLERGTPDMILR